MGDDEIRMDNIENLTEEQLKILEQRYKEQYLPNYRLYLLVPFNLVTAGFTMYYTIHFKYYSKKLFSPKKFGFREVIKYGTIQSIVFTSFYILGTAAITGLYNPIEYMRGLAKIKGKQIDTALKFDPNFQKHFLFNLLDYFGVSDKVVNEVKDELLTQKNQLESKNYFSKETSKLLNQDLDNK
ncbi:unnamed protein product [Paramecium pentaurelia]|uniref:Transmembrane protein n=1 Tax=Paramecium pentaurelia TaxID=43138 RepID=A0A8S1X7N5_9CILI|nr:unnamed protein product [Paramecium pentaurelia]